jgi:hypothetical protein
MYTNQGFKMTKVATDQSDLNSKFLKLADSSKERLDEFISQFAKDPAYAFAWSADAFYYAARFSVFTIIAEGSICSYEATAAKNIIVKQIIELTRSPAQSTSATSNLMKQYELVAWTEALDVFDYL